jgi:hypothetical protein
MAACVKLSFGMGKMTDRQLVFEDFADKVGEEFTVGEDGVPAISMTLKEAKLLNPNFGLEGVRPPFSLSFLAADPRVFPQRLYRLQHARLGEVTIFLVPSGKDAAGVSYHATFN